MNQSTDFIGVADLDGKVLYVNRSARRLVGLSQSEDVRMLRIQDFVFPEDVPALENTVVPTVLREGRWQAETRFRHFQTGAGIPVDYHVFPITDPKTGEIVALATATRDISERKTAEAALLKSEEQYRVLAELSPQGCGPPIAMAECFMRTRDFWNMWARALPHGRHGVSRSFL